MVNKGRIVRNSGTIVAAGQITYNETSQERRLAYILRERGGHGSVLNIGVISSDSSFLNIILVYVRGVDFRVTRLEVERESVNCCRNPDGSDMGKGALS